MRKHKLIIALCAVLLGLSACNESEHLPPVVKDGEVLVNLSAGEQNLSVTKANFAADVPVTVLVFKRTTAGTPADVTGAPYRTFQAKTSGSSLVPVTADEKLTVLSGSTYDFYAFANPKEELTGGTMSVSHGTDLLVGSFLNMEVPPTGVTSIKVTFGDLPHLGSQVQFTASPNLDPSNGGFKEGFIKSFGVTKVTWSKLPSWGTLILNPSSATQALETSTAYTSKFEVVPAQVEGNASEGFKVGDKGVILPYPLADAARGHNLVDLNFSLAVNGGNVSFPATGVQVPAFEPGKSYKFSLELLRPDDNLDGKINLYLSIVAWNKTAWTSGMGGDGTTSESAILIGSWNGVRWTSGMGGDGTASNQILYVGGWNSINWITEMGK